GWILATAGVRGGGTRRTNGWGANGAGGIVVWSSRGAAARPHRVNGPAGRVSTSEGSDGGGDWAGYGRPQAAGAVCGDECGRKHFDLYATRDRRGRLH